MRIKVCPWIKYCGGDGFFGCGADRFYLISEKVRRKPPPMVSHTSSRKTSFKLNAAFVVSIFISLEHYIQIREMNSRDLFPNEIP